MIEIYIFYQINKAGVKPLKIIYAHKELGEKFSITNPFANRKVIQNLNTDGKEIFFDIGDDRIITLNIEKQFNLSFIKMFYKKIEFDEDLLAERYWPDGKENSIVCDPKKKFGIPIIEGKNIYPETIFDMFKAGDSIQALSTLYGLTKKQVKDAIEFCQQKH
jgi:uncharacterized protein (DUF433 family)